MGFRGCGSKEGTMAASARGMGPEERAAKFVKEICAGDMHAARAAAALGVSAIGVWLAQARRTATKHGVKQVDRLPSNKKLDMWEAFGWWVPHMLGRAQGGDGVAGLDVVRGGWPGGGGAVDDDAPRAVDAARLADGAGEPPDEAQEAFRFLREAVRGGHRSRVADGAVAAGSSAAGSRLLDVRLRAGSSAATRRHPRDPTARSHSACLGPPALRC